ncbi:AAA family ATPase [Microbispora sp. NPDC049125]|uniref:ATP-binding protein n=1 Tax=Microbispora sp. NPDC049125 TaxID=3154929 RepID=UPI003464F6B3
MRSAEATTGLIGRDHPAALLRAEIVRAAGSHGGLVLVTGEAGIGKTTLVTSAAEEARRLGALVLGGSCWDSGSAPGYWPWVQVLRGLRRGAAPGEWGAAEEAAGGSLAALLGESPGADTVDGFRLYDAVTSALVSVSQRRPVVVLLEDLHWADTASLRLLGFAAQHTWFERVLLVGTYRDVEVAAADHPLRSLVPPLEARATTITLTGLERDEVGALIARTAGRDPSAGLVAQVHRRTGGNPFFVEETARLWRSGGSVTTVAPGVRDTLLRRLSLLPGPVVELLTTAAVLGREFHRQVLAATAPMLNVDRLLDQAMTSRLVVAREGEVFAFAHDLVRETLYRSIEDEEVPGRHAAVLSAVDRSPDAADHVLPADLARHAYLAGHRVEPARAVDHLLAAARDAVRRLATEEAIGHYRRALELAVADAPRRRVVIALELGRELFHQEDRDAGIRVFQEAVACAHEMGDPELLARVALSIHGDWGGDTGEIGAGLLREVHAKLLPGDSPDEPSLDRLARDLAIHAAGLAREGRDDETLAVSLWAHHNTIWGPGTASERVALTGELMTVARRTADPEMEGFAASLRWVALLEQGDPRYLDQFHTYVALGERGDLPRMGMATVVDRSIVAAFMGRFDEAESLLDQVTALDGRLAHDQCGYWLDHHRWAMRMLQGRFDDLDELHGRLLRSRHPCPGLLRAMTELRRGDVDAAMRHLADAVARGEAHDRSLQPLWLRFQAMVAVSARDMRLCEKARAEIEPYAGTWAVSMYGWDIGGPMVFWLALLDAGQERWDEAIDGFRLAGRSADLLGARPWSIEARSHLGEALLARGSPGDAEQAVTLLDDVEREVAQIGMRHIAERVGRARLRMRPSAAGLAPGTASDQASGTASGPPHEFRRDGAVWSLGFGGHTVHLPDAKGLRDLHSLLSRRGVDVPAVQLLDPEGGRLVVAARQMGGDALLDEEAKTRYRRRLAQLDEEIDRAAELGDDDKAAEFDREREALLAELRRASGLGGRDRRLGDEAERARKAVTARIRDVLRKLDRLHPALAAHLRAGVSTGANCRYQPDQEIHWRL